MGENAVGREQDEALAVLVDFFNACRVGYEGCEGYRKSTDPVKLLASMREIEHQGLIQRDRTVFLDLGCADGRVNLLVSPFVKWSLGIEIDPIIVAEYEPRRHELEDRLRRAGLPLPADNVRILLGDSLDEATYERFAESCGVRFEDVDLFYTYITLHDLFGEHIAARAREGALYLVYGFNRILPRYDGLELVIPDVAAQGIMALYRKAVKP